MSWPQCNAGRLRRASIGWITPRPGTTTDAISLALAAQALLEEKPRGHLIDGDLFEDADPGRDGVQEQIQRWQEQKAASVPGLAKYLEGR